MSIVRKADINFFAYLPIFALRFVFVHLSLTSDSTSPIGFRSTNAKIMVINK